MCTTGCTHLLLFDVSWTPASTNGCFSGLQGLHLSSAGAARGESQRLLVSPLWQFRHCGSFATVGVADYSCQAVPSSSLFSPPSSVSLRSDVRSSSLRCSALASRPMRNWTHKVGGKRPTTAAATQLATAGRGPKVTWTGATWRGVRQLLVSAWRVRDRTWEETAGECRSVLCRAAPHHTAAECSAPHDTSDTRGTPDTTDFHDTCEMSQMTLVACKS